MFETKDGVKTGYIRIHICYDHEVLSLFMAILKEQR